MPLENMIYKYLFSISLYSGDGSATAEDPSSTASTHVGQIIQLPVSLTPGNVTPSTLETLPPVAYTYTYTEAHTHK